MFTPLILLYYKQNTHQLECFYSVYLGLNICSLAQHLCEFWSIIDLWQHPLSNVIPHLIGLSGLVRMRRETGKL